MIIGFESTKPCALAPLPPFQASCEPLKVLQTGLLKALFYLMAISTASSTEVGLSLSWEGVWSVISAAVCRTVSLAVETAASGPSPRGRSMYIQKLSPFSHIFEFKLKIPLASTPPPPTSCCLPPSWPVY